MIKQAKLNTCSCRKNLYAVFDVHRRLYFVCPIHKVILDALVARELL